MEILFNYYIKRKSDGKIMEILHTELTEDEIIEAVKEKLTAPINYNMEDEDGKGEYVFCNIIIDEIKGLR